MTKETNFLIEERLPIEFLTDLGIYIQTCAHIELMICALICELEELEMNSEEWQERHFKLRKKTRPAELFRTLKSAATNNRHPERLDPSLIHDLVEWMERYISNRHIAVHGAFFLDAHRSIRVNYWHEDTSVNPPVRSIENAVISKPLVEELTHDADRILRSLWGALARLGAV